MPILSSQVSSVQTVSIQINKDLQQILVFLDYIKTMESCSWNLTIPFTEEAVPVGDTCQTNLLSQYDTLKAQLLADVNQLP